MSKFHINKHGVPAPCRAINGNCPLGGDGEHFDSLSEAKDYVDKTNEEDHGILPEIKNSKEEGPTFISDGSGGVIRFDTQQEATDYLNEKRKIDIEISEEHAISLGLDGEAGFHEYKFEAGPRKEDIDLYANLGNEACIALKKALPEEVFENNEDFTLVAEENVEAFYKNAIMVPSHRDIHESHYKNMAATVKAKYPNLVSDKSGWHERIDQDLSDKIAKFAAEKSLKESNLSINGSKVIVADHKERNWAAEYFNAQKYADYKERNWAEEYFDPQK